MTDDRRYAPATLRNRASIAEVLAGVLPDAGTVLEIASGSGEHAIHFAEMFPHLTLQPTDPDDQAIASIAAWVRRAALPNLRPPLQLDVTAPVWPVARADAILCINMVHVAPWAATAGLLHGAAACLPPGAPLFLYGPYRRAGVPTAASNEAFDADLRTRNPAWGLKHIEAIVSLAADCGFSVPRITEMPANNLSVVFRRS